jgi:hypothetical protein
MSVLPTSAKSAWSKSTRRTFRYFEIPRSLRALVRAREFGLIVLAAAVGALAGLVVAAILLDVLNCLNISELRHRDRNGFS